MVPSSVLSFYVVPHLAKLDQTPAPEPLPPRKPYVPSLLLTKKKRRQLPITLAVLSDEARELCQATATTG